MDNKVRKGVKLFQYFMILVVFAAALILPRYAAKWQAASLLKNEMSGADNTSEEMTEVQNAQTIVLDPGHGGCQLRYGEAPLRSDFPRIGKKIL
ncbi:MAG: hypothetical protein LUD12_10715 [Lachnospiraceae bacterium]|nr:hypothetical protein [Lachnospiraceae bacterium]